MTKIVLLLVVGLAGNVSKAPASLGGPELAEVLGWDARERKVFIALHHLDESGYFPTVVYFDLRRPSPRAVAARWSLEDIGIACEGDEVQVPVLLAGKPLLVEWIRYRQ